MVKAKLSSTVSSKGQVTLPLRVRERLGLKKGDRVEFVFDYDETLIRPARGTENPFSRYIGALPAFKGKGESNKWVASLREDESDR